MGGDLFNVHFRHGRTGARGQGGVKTSTPVPFDKATKKFGQLLVQKIKKGYTPAAHGLPFHDVEHGSFVRLLHQLDSRSCNTDKCSTPLYSTPEDLRDHLAGLQAMYGRAFKKLTIEFKKPLPLAASALFYNAKTIILENVMMRVSLDALEIQAKTSFTQTSINLGFSNPELVRRITDIKIDTAAIIGEEGRTSSLLAA
mgnify:CR=1 FL=1